MIDGERTMGKGPLSISSLVSAANNGKWREVDASLARPRYNRKEYVGWAVTNLSIQDPNLRDLAASVFESLPALEFEDVKVDEVVAGLEKIMTDKAEDADYLPARFHAALAVIKHGQDSAAARAVIAEAAEQTDDPELAEMAAESLRNLGELETDGEDSAA